MHFKLSLTILVSGVLLSGCFIADELFETPREEQEEDIQVKAERNIKAQINAQLEDEEYAPYGFSELKVIKPLEIVELEKLEKRAETAPNDTALTRMIKEKKAFIRENGIERSAEVDHFFTLIADTSTINVMEVKYILNDTLGVKKTEPSIILPVPTSYQLILDYYFNEYTIFIAPTYAEGRKMSRTFYRFFKDQLETYTTIGDKSDFLRHTLDICQLVKLTGKFEQDFIVQTLFKQYIKTEREDIKEYEALEFSDLYETRNNEDDSVVGYYFFHKFIGNYENQTDTNVVLVEFSPYYEVDQVFQLDGPFESYIKKKQ